MTIAGIIFIGSVFFFLFVPALKDVNQLSSDVVDAQTELEAQYTNRKNLIQSISQVAHIKQTTENLKGQFLKPGDEILFIRNIEAIALAHDVESSIRINTTKASKIAVPVNDAFEIGLVGTYQNVLSAMRSIERLPNLTIISAVNVRAGDLSVDTPTIVSATLKGTLIFTPEGL